jgi:hypothetical protein
VIVRVRVKFVATAIVRGKVKFVATVIVRVPKVHRAMVNVAQKHGPMLALTHGPMLVALTRGRMLVVPTRPAMAKFAGLLLAAKMRN